jgi:hypothetical protein
MHIDSDNYLINSKYIRIYSKPNPPLIQNSFNIVFSINALFKLKVVIFEMMLSKIFLLEKIIT